MLHISPLAFVDEFLFFRYFSRSCRIKLNWIELEIISSRVKWQNYTLFSFFANKIKFCQPFEPFFMESHPMRFDLMIHAKNIISAHWIRDCERLRQKERERVQITSCFVKLTRNCKPPKSLNTQRNKTLAGSSSMTNPTPSGHREKNQMNSMTHTLEK